MPQSLPRRITIIWLLLVLATGLSWGSAHDLGHLGARTATMAAILIAFFKARLIILDFMEVRHAPLPLRLICEAWVVVVAGALIAIMR